MKLIKVFSSVSVLIFSASVFSADNDIYITQTGTGLTLTIDQVGAGNVVGTSQARVSLSGTGMTVDIDQLGDTNTLAASIGQANTCLLYTSPSPRDVEESRMPSSA